MRHPNEPALVFQAPSGTWLPSRDLTEYTNAAAVLGARYVDALRVQINRQCDVIAAPVRVGSDET